MEKTEKIDNLTAARVQLSKGNYENTLKLLDEIEKKGLLYPEVYVLRYLCSLHYEDDREWDEIEGILQQALEIDPKYPEALIELADFKYVIMDNVADGQPLFEKARKLIFPLLIEAILGEAGCIDELESPQSALAFIEKMKSEVFEGKEVQEFLNDLDLNGE